MTDDTQLHRLYSRARLDDREVNELIGLALGITADNIISKDEVDFLHRWLVAHTEVTSNPVVKLLHGRIDAILADGIVEPEEAAELLTLLKKFSAGDLELGETLKSTTLPLDAPPPNVVFQNSRFCLSGTFAFGSRRECENAILMRGGLCGSLTLQTRYLVIGAYATESWAHSSFGRKIEKAVELREIGQPISIVGEDHWVGQMRSS